MEQSERYKQSLLKSIQREWLALLAAVERLTPEQMVTPDSGGWAPKDNLAHLTQWMKALTGHHFDGKPAGEVLGLPAELDENFDFNRVNDWMFEHSKHLPADEVLDELKAKYAEVMARLESMSLETLMQPRDADDPQKRPLVLWVLGNTSEHFAEHRAMIEKQFRGRDAG
jgi:hypothetical protein